MDTKLTIGGIVSHAIGIGTKNALPLLGAVLLWSLAFSIPYLNVGATIGLLGMVTRMGRGGVVSPMEIFEAKYRSKMGEFFLVLIFVTMGVSIGFAFLIIPGIVIGLSWQLAPLLVIDKGMRPMDAIDLSSKLMHGNQWAVFLAPFALALGGGVVIVVITAIAGSIEVAAVDILAGLLILVVGLAVVAGSLGINAYVYAALVPEDVLHEE